MENFPKEEKEKCKTTETVLSAKQQTQTTPKPYNTCTTILKTA